MTKKPRLYIHVGLPKTGSTSIQLEMKKNWKLYCRCGIIPIDKVIWPMIKAGMMLNINPKMNLIKLKKMSKYISQYTESSYLLSSEYYVGNMGMGTPEFNIIQKWLSPLVENFDVVPIVYLRRQDIWIESLYVQRVQSGKFEDGEEFETFIKNQSIENYDWQRLIEKLKLLTENNKIIVRFYEKSILTDGLINDFRSAIGINEKLYYEQKKNISVSTTGIKIAKAVQPDLTIQEKVHFRLNIQKTMISKITKHYIFSDVDRKKFLDNFIKSNQRVINKYSDPDSREKLQNWVNIEDFFQKNEEKIDLNQVSSLIINLTKKSTPSVMNICKMCYRLTIERLIYSRQFLAINSIYPFNHLYIFRANRMYLKNRDA